jgi:hypothetical protein
LLRSAIAPGRADPPSKRVGANPHGGRKEPHSRREGLRTAGCGEEDERTTHRAQRRYMLSSVVVARRSLGRKEEQEQQCGTQQENAQSLMEIALERGGGPPESCERSRGAEAEENVSSPNEVWSRSVCRPPRGWRDGECACGTRAQYIWVVWSCARAGGHAAKSCWIRVLQKATVSAEPAARRRCELTAEPGT